MTVAARPASVSYQEDGQTVSFPAPFRFKSARALVVERIRVDGTIVALQLGVDYTVSGGATDAGGTVTRTAATAGATLRIRRWTERAQSMTYTTGDRFPATSHEEALDQQMLVSQEQDALQEETRNRALMVPPGEVMGDLPPLAKLAGAALVFDDEGRPIAKPVGSFPAGPPGPADNTYTPENGGLTAFKASDINRGTASLVGLPGIPDGRFNWTPGNFSATVDPQPVVNVISSRDVPITQGAWIRQRADGVAYKQISTGTALDRINEGSLQLDAFVAGLSGSFPQDATTIVESLVVGGRVDNRDVAGKPNFPRGQYRKTRPTSVPNSVAIVGDGPEQSKFQNFVAPVHAGSVFICEDPNIAYHQAFRNIAIWGGPAGYFIGTAQGTDGLSFENVTFFGQSVGGIVCERLFQTTSFVNTIFDQSTRGIWVQEHTSNAITFTAGAFKNLTGAALELNGVEGVHCYGTRFEGGVDPDNPLKATCELQNVREISFNGVYFENTNRTLVRSRLTGGVGPILAKDGGSISFNECHFTGANGRNADGSIGLYPYLWDVEGPISFTNCHSSVPMRVPSQAVLIGHNRNLLRTTRSGTLVSKQIRPAAGDNFLLTIDLSDAAATASNVTALTGRLMITLARVDANGGGFTTLSREYSVAIRATSGLKLEGAVSLIKANDLEGGTTMIVGLAGQTEQSLQVVASLGVIGATDAAAMLGWTFQWDQVCSRPGNMFAVGLA